MRTRNAGTPKNPASNPKTPTSQKKTPPSKKSVVKTAVTPPPIVEESRPDIATPLSLATPSSEPDLTPASESAGEQVMASNEDAAIVPPTKAGGPKKKVTKIRKVIKKVLRPKTPASAKAASASTMKVDETLDVKGDQDQKDDDITYAKNGLSPNAEEVVMEAKKVTKKVISPKTPALGEAGIAEKADKAEDAKGEQGQKDDDMTNAKDEQSLKAGVVDMKASESEDQEELGTERAGDLGDTLEKGKTKMDVDDSSIADTGIDGRTESPVTEDTSKSVEESSEAIEAQAAEKSNEPIEEVNEVAVTLESEKETQDRLDNVDDDQPLANMDDVEKPGDMDADHTEKAEDEATQPKHDDATASEDEDYGDEDGFVEPGEEDLREDDEPETIEDTKALDEEHKELAAAAKERKIKKEHEIFVGGLDREVTEDHVKKAFEKAGEVVEVRLLKDPVTNKNRGFAFVRFATKDEAKKALSEMKNPVICGKRCGTAANEDNDTLFVGNICNTWTKEAIKQKLKDYNVEGVESITLVQDPRHEGLSRGFCFIQFACHADAMFAYKRLQKPDAVFGHAERTAKVAFAEPLQEPDPEVMAKVKSVFVDGIPPFWDEDRVRKHFQGYGEIERVTLARNMSNPKRKDFGFVDYMTHEAALACIEDVNKKELVDGNSKTKVRARLSNPLPKMQAVKGGMCGGFRIGRPTGRSLGGPGPPVNRPSFQHGRVSRGPFNDPIGPFGRRIPHRGGHGAQGASAPGRSNFGVPRHGLTDRGPLRPAPRREPFPLDDGGYSRSFMGRHYDAPYMYNDNYGLKRPFYMTEQDPGYMEPSRVRPRFDYSGSGRGSHFRDTSGAGSSMYSSGYYSADYGAPARPHYGADYGESARPHYGADYRAPARPHSSDYGAPARPHSSFNGQDRSYGSGRGRGSSSGGGHGRGSGYY